MKWKKTIGWALAGLVIVLLAAAVGGYFYLQSRNFQAYAVSKIVEQADQTTGGKTEIGGVDFSLSTLTAHLYNIKLRGKEGPGQPPLLQADKLTVRIKIVSAFHQHLALRELLIDHPVVHLQVSQDGKNNMPAAPPSQGSSQATILILRWGMCNLRTARLITTIGRLRSTPIFTTLESTFISMHCWNATRAIFLTIEAKLITPSMRHFTTV